MRGPRFPTYCVHTMMHGNRLDTIITMITVHSTYTACLHTIQYYRVRTVHTTTRTVHSTYCTRARVASSNSPPLAFLANRQLSTYYVLYTIHSTYTVDTTAGISASEGTTQQPWYEGLCWAWLALPPESDASTNRERANAHPIRTDEKFDSAERNHG